jgi:hypothetical protein
VVKGRLQKLVNRHVAETKFETDRGHQTTSLDREMASKTGCEASEILAQDDQKVRFLT